eukprot:SAG11_NODE_2867_length_2890_cov_1.583662_3_plen_114_part_00
MHQRWFICHSELVLLGRVRWRWELAPERPFDACLDFLGTIEYLLRKLIRLSCTELGEAVWVEFCDGSDTISADSPRRWRQIPYAFKQACQSGEGTHLEPWPCMQLLPSSQTLL